MNEVDTVVSALCFGSVNEWMLRLALFRSRLRDSKKKGGTRLSWGPFRLCPLSLSSLDADFFLAS